MLFEYKYKLIRGWWKFSEAQPRMDTQGCPPGKFTDKLLGEFSFQTRSRSEWKFLFGKNSPPSKSFVRRFIDSRAIVWSSALLGKCAVSL